MSRKIPAATTPMPRTPPMNLEAEQAVLGAVLLDGTLAPSIVHLQAAMFHLERHRDVFRAIQALVAAGEAVDALTVADALRRTGAFDAAGGHTTLATLQEAGTVATQLEAAATIVRDYAVRREIIRVTREVAVAGYDERVPVDRLLGTLVDACVRLEHDHLPAAIQEPEAIAAAMRDERPLPRLRTGLPIYDRDGGLTLGDMHLLAGRPALGKTTVGLQLAHHVTHTEGFAALFTSAEMDAQQIRLKLARLATPNEVAASGFHLVDPTGPTVAEVAALIRRAVASSAVQLAVVDHAQEIASARPHDRRDLEIREIATVLRDLAKQLGIAVLLLSQLNREVERRNNPRPLLSDLRDGGALEEQAATVTFLWSAEADHERKPLVPITFTMRKNRHGPIPPEWTGTLAKESGRVEARLEPTP